MDLYLNWCRDSDIRYNQKDDFNSSKRGSSRLKTKKQKLQRETPKIQISIYKYNNT